MGTKHKVCISVDEETLLLIREGIRSKQFRNRSHAFELAISNLIKGDTNDS